MDTTSQFLEKWNGKFPDQEAPDVSFLTAGAGRGRKKFVLQDELKKVDETISKLKSELEKQEFLKGWIEQELEEFKGLGKAVAALKESTTATVKNPNMAMGGQGGPSTSPPLKRTGVDSGHQNSVEGRTGREPIFSSGRFKPRQRENVYETIDDFPLNGTSGGTPKAASFPPPGEAKSKEVQRLASFKTGATSSTSTGDLYTQVKKPKPSIKPKPVSFRGSINRKDSPTPPTMPLNTFGKPIVQPHLHVHEGSFRSSFLEELKVKQQQDQVEEIKPSASVKQTSQGRPKPVAPDVVYELVGDVQPKEAAGKMNEQEAAGFLERENPLYDQLGGDFGRTKGNDNEYDTVKDEINKTETNEYMTVGEENLDSIGSEGNIDSMSYAVGQKFHHDHLRDQLGGGDSDDSVEVSSTESGELDNEPGAKSSSSSSKKSVRYQDQEGASLNSLAVPVGPVRRKSVISGPVDMRKLVVAGILESDAVYRECLETLRHYMRLLKASSTTSQPAMVMTDHDVIFYKIEELYEINVEFYGKLKYRLDNWTEDMQVGDLFLESTKSFPVYGDYVNNYQKAMETVEKCRRENENFENVAQRIPKPSSKENLVTLEGLLYRPLQRVTKMTLTLHDLMKHTPTDSPDYKILQKALTCSEEFLSQVNERAKLKGKLKKEHKKSPSTSKESQKKRKLIKEGHIVEQVDRTNRKLRQIFLYTDVIICAKQKTTSSLLSGPKEQYDCKWYIPVNDLLLNPQDDQCPATPVPVPGEESLETLRARIAETKMQIRSVQGEGNKKPNKGAQKNIDKNRKKLAEMEGQMLLISPNLPLRLANKDGKSYTLLMSSDYERSEWRESIEKAITNIKAKPSNSTPVSAYEIQSLTARQKVKTLHQNVTSMIIKDDEELMSGILKVNVHSATNFEREGNYYCCLEVDSYGHFYLIAKTNCSPATKQAEWNQEFELDIDGAQTLRILCYRQEDSTNGDTLVGKGAHEMPKLNQKDTRVAVKLDSIEVTVSMNYDSHGRQTMKRFKSKRSGGVFGVKIGKVTKREGTNIPNIITTCCSEIERRGLSELGIYRISGVTSDIQKLKKAFENNARNVDTLVAESDIHAIACVVKLYFRELPEPLFTNELYNNFVNGFGLSDVHAKQNCMVSLLENLPEPNQSTVIYLLEHLRRVANNEIENKMTLHNLATVFGPNLLRPSVNVDEENASSQSFMLLEATCFTNVMAQVGVFLYYLEGKAELPTSESHDL